ncbi:hypothetical protein [Rhizobium binae]|nr:hypothetical protein [Rhizobium binae]
MAIDFKVGVLLVEDNRRPLVSGLTIFGEPMSAAHQANLFSAAAS